MTEHMTVRIDSGMASMNEKSGAVVAYNKPEKKIAVKFPAYTHNAVKHRAMYIVFNVVNRDDAGLLIMLDVVEQLRFLIREPSKGYGIVF